VRIGLLAMPIHPADLLQIDGAYGVRPDLPFVAGHEGVGVVLEHAPEVTDLPVGTRVLAMGAGGFWCDERVLHRRALWPLPAEGEVLQQAMLGANPATASVMLRHLVALAPGSWVLQNAANSAVGQCVRQLAPLLSLKLVNVVRRPDAVPPSAEVDQVWVVDDGQAPEAFRDRVAAVVGDGTVGLALDAVGGSASASLAAALGDGGTLVVYGLLSGRPSELPAHDLVFRGVQVRGFWLARWFADPDHRTAARELFPQLLEWAGHGRLQMTVQSVHDLDQVAQAMEEAARPQRSGKVLLSGAWLGREVTRSP
jgi:NADPH:quinone reductase-like Zn-dependent oxidoreductase